MKFLFKADWEKKVSPRKVKAHARKIFQSLFPKGYPGEIFLCGGAFKPLFDERLKINDLDLWVRNRKERERLVAALIDGGAELVHDFVPYCMKFMKDGQAIEITYHNVKDGGIPDIVGGFDLGLSAIGAAYRDGAIREVYISDALKKTLEEKTVLLQNSYIPRVREQHPVSLLATVDRMLKFADDIGYSVDPAAEECWEIFEHVYNDEEKQKSLEIYQEIMVDYKSRSNTVLLDRATDLVLSS